MAHFEDYGLERPTEEDAVQALAALVGAETAHELWNLSVRSLGPRRPVETAADLRRVAEHRSGSVGAIAGGSAPHGRGRRWLGGLLRG
jgi:hypothetical protein